MGATRSGPRSPYYSVTHISAQFPGTSRFSVHTVKILNLAVPRGVKISAYGHSGVKVCVSDPAAGVKIWPAGCRGDENL